MAENKRRWFELRLAGWTIVLVAIVSLLVAFLPTALIYLHPNWFASFSTGSANFGASFGAASAILSAAAFIAVVLTLYVQHQELQHTREELKLTRVAQEKSEGRLLLSAYASVLESLRQLSEWRMSKDPAHDNRATFAVVEGLVIQARVKDSLLTIARDLEPDVRNLFKSLKRVGEEGSWVWLQERLMTIYLNLGLVLQSHRHRTEDRAAFLEAKNIVDVQLADLAYLKRFFSGQRATDFASIASKVVATERAIGVPEEGKGRNEHRETYFNNVGQARDNLLRFVQSMTE